MSENDTAKANTPQGHTPGRWVATMDGKIHFQGEGNPRHILGPFRLAACLNECEGISTEALEDGAVGGILEALQRCVDDFDMALRDGYEGVLSEDDFAEHLAPYRAAIAKVQGRS